MGFGLFSRTEVTEDINTLFTGDNIQMAIKYDKCVLNS